jgi:hypothetical protein
MWPLTRRRSVRDRSLTLLDEWAYVRLYRSNTERLAALPRYVDFCNRRRPHTALRGLVPLASLNNVLKQHI